MELRMMVAESPAATRGASRALHAHGARVYLFSSCCHRSARSSMTSIEHGGETATLAVAGIMRCVRAHHWSARPHVQPGRIASTASCQPTEIMLSVMRNVRNCHAGASPHIGSKRSGTS